MKSIKLSHDSKNAIKHYGGKTYDESVNQLIDTVQDYMPLIDYTDSSRVVVNLKEDTVDRLNSFRLSNGESAENIIIRMLIISQVLNSNSD